jgi:hypothetical protein
MLYWYLYHSRKLDERSSYAVRVFSYAEAIQRWKFLDLSNKNSINTWHGVNCEGQ